MSDGEKKKARQGKGKRRLKLRFNNCCKIVLELSHSLLLHTEPKFNLCVLRFSKR